MEGLINMKRRTSHQEPKRSPTTVRDAEERGQSCVVLLDQLCGPLCEVLRDQRCGWRLTLGSTTRAADAAGVVSDA
jgi:hypothetical protein